MQAIYWKTPDIGFYQFSMQLNRLTGFEIGAADHARIE